MLAYAKRGIELYDPQGKFFYFVPDRDEDGNRLMDEKKIGPSVGGIWVVVLLSSFVVLLTALGGRLMVIYPIYLAITVYVLVGRRRVCMTDRIRYYRFSDLTGSQMISFRVPNEDIFDIREGFTTKLTFCEFTGYRITQNIYWRVADTKYRNVEILPDVFTSVFSEPCWCASEPPPFNVLMRGMLRGRQLGLDPEIFRDQVYDTWLWLREYFPLRYGPGMGFQRAVHQD
jgi:hypothetical protein